MKFIALSEQAQQVAIQQYRKGWEETHPDPDDSIEDWEICVSLENLDEDFNEDGTVSEDNEY